MEPRTDPRLSFDRAADAYDRARPTYPADLFEALFELLPAEPEILEVGPGTGKATRDLLDRRAWVHAIEIGPALAVKLRSNLPSQRLRITVGDFEVVDLAPGAVDAVFSSTAYHWIARAAQTDRPATLLRPGGVLAVVDLVQVASPDDAGFFAASQPIYDRYGQGHTGPPAPGRTDVDPAIREVLGADGRFESVQVRRYDWNQRYSAARYRQLMLSYSGIQMMGERERRGLLDDIETFVRDDFGGGVTRPLVATLTTATLTDRCV